MNTPPSQQQYVPQRRAAREAKFYIAPGMKGIGKTYQTELLIQKYLQGNPAVGMKPRKVLVFDVNNEYKKYKPISADRETLLQFVAHPMVECRRVAAIKPNGEVKGIKDFQEDMVNISNIFRNGMLVLEDLSTFVGNNLSMELFGRLCTNRHRDLDIVTHVQSLSRLSNPQFLNLANLIRMHKTIDSSAKVKDKFLDHYPIIRISELIISKRYNIGVEKLRQLSPDSNQYRFFENDYKRFFLYVDLEEHKITGRFTKDEFIEQCKTYLHEDASKEIASLAKRRDENTGKPKYTYQQAFNAKLTELMTYYGNKV